MGLFSLTKKPEEKRPVQQMPSFPQFPETNQEEEMPEFPAYEPSIGDIKKEITKPVEFDIPIREKRVENRNMFASQPMQQSQMQMEEFSPARVSSATNSMPSEGHPLFIKIDKFKEAMHDMQNLKAKISEAEKILSSLEELKADEDAKLSKWNSEVQELKEKLMSLDKNLFEQ